MREIVNQCRAGLLAIGIAHQISKLYCDDQSLDCDILDLFACSLVSVGMTYTQTREIHIQTSKNRRKIILKHFNYLVYPSWFLMISMTFKFITKMRTIELSQIF